MPLTPPLPKPPGMGQASGGSPPLAPPAPTGPPSQPSEVSLTLSAEDLTPVEGTVDGDPGAFQIRPLQDKDYQDLARQIAKDHGIPGEVFVRLVGQESAWNPLATSKVGARGLAQLMPATAEELGVVNLDDPIESLTGGAKYFRKMLERYQGDVRKALAAYNAGPGTVDRYQGIPPFPETQQYVGRILGIPEGGVPGPATLPLTVNLRKDRTQLAYTPPPIPSPEGLVDPSTIMPGEPGSRIAEASAGAMAGLRGVLPASGAMVGGAKGLQAGLRVPGPPALKAAGGVIGALGGAFLGGGAGEALQVGGEALAGEDRTLGEASARMQEAGKAGAVGEVGGAALGGAVGAGLRVVGKGVVGKLAPAAKASLTKFREAYTTVLGNQAEAPLATPGQVSDNQLVDWVEAIARNAPFRSRKIGELDQKQAAAVETYLQSVLDRFGLPQSAEDVGRMLSGARDALRKQATAPLNEAYATIDEASQGSRVSLQPLLEYFKSSPQGKAAFFRKAEKFSPGLMARAQQKVAEIAHNAPRSSPGLQRLGQAATEEGLPQVDPAMAAMEELVGELGDDFSISAPQARALLTHLGEGLPSASGQGKGDLSQVYKVLRGGLEQAYDEAGVGSLFRTTQAQYRGVQQKFANDFIERQLKDSPSRTIGRMVGKVGAAPRFTPEEVRQLRGVSSKRVWRAVQRSTVAKLLSPNVPGKPFQASRTLTHLEAHPEWFAEVFPETQARRQVVEALKRVAALQGGSKPAGGSGKMWIQFQTAGAIGALVGGVASGRPTEGTAGATAILLTPRLVGRLLTSPAGRRLLIEGASIPEGVKGLTDGPTLRFPPHLLSQWAREEDQEGGREGGGGEGLQDGPPPDQDRVLDEQEILRRLEEEDRRLEELVGPTGPPAR